jgi:hypothetical protein
MAKRSAPLWEAHFTALPVGPSSDQFFGVPGFA